MVSWRGASGASSPSSRERGERCRLLVFPKVLTRPLRPPLPAQMAASLDKLRAHWRDGEIGPTTLVWTEGMGKRMMVRDVPSLLACLQTSESTPSPPTPSRDSGGWEPGGRRQRAAAAAAASGESSPALVLDLLRELKATQEKVREQRAVIDNLTQQRRALVDDKRRARREDDEARREIALAEAEAEARDLIIVLRSLVADERAKMHGSPSPPSRSAATLAPRGPVPVPGPAPVPASASSRALPPRPATASAIVTRRYLPPASFATDPLARVLAGRGSSRAPRGPDAREVARASASDVDAYARTIRGDGRRPARGGIARETDASRHAKELSTAVVATVKMFADAGVRLPLRERTGAGEGWGGAPAAGGGRAYELHGRKLTLTARGGKVLVRAGGGWSDLLEWLARNRFWERAAREREASGAGDERELFYH